MRVLIVEDDKNLAITLRNQLRSHYFVETAYSCKEASQKIESNGYDLVVLDLSLPDGDGSDVCARLRNQGSKASVLVLTGRDDVVSKVAALDSGADDYLTKPFNASELEARVRALLRRRSRDLEPSKLVLDDLELDPAARKVRRQGREIALRRKEFDLLEYLMRNEGKALTRNMILDNVWEVGTDVWANVVDVHVNYLRRKIDQPFGKKLIKTVHGVGYKIES